MFDYLQQFNNLPKSLRDQISSPLVMETISKLEKKYQIDLAMTVMKVMVKSLALRSLPVYFVSDFGLSQAAAESLTQELKAQVFIAVSSHLGLEQEARALDLDADIELIIKEAGLMLASGDLVQRFKGVLSTYLKGIRDKIAARDALVKPAVSGGLSLTPAEADRVFKVCSEKTFRSLDIQTLKTMPPQSRLDKIVAANDGKPKATEEYSLKQALATGQIKKPAEMVKLPLQEKELSLPLAVSQVEELKKTPAPPATPKIIPPVEIKKAEPKVQAEIKVAPQTKAEIKFEPVKVPEVKLNQPLSANRPPVVPVMAPVVERKPIATARPIFAPSISKKIMQDVKPAPKVMGPLEELQFLDLINFRRLGKTPTEAVTKIFSKIKLLEADGYDKMVAGVQAWRQSPINHLYLKTLQAAIGKGLTVKDYVISKQKEDKEALKWEEIEAILAMNSKLVF